MLDRPALKLGFAERSLIKEISILSSTSNPILGAG